MLPEVNVQTEAPAAVESNLFVLELRPMPGIVLVLPARGLYDTLQRVRTCTFHDAAVGQGSEEYGAGLCAGLLGQSRFICI